MASLDTQKFSSQLDVSLGYFSGVFVHLAAGSAAHASHSASLHAMTRLTSVDHATSQLEAAKQCDDSSCNDTTASD